MTGDRFTRIRRTLPAFFLLLFAAVSASAHGTGFQLVESRKARAVNCYYASGDPMAYSKVLVYGPGDSDIEHQNGRTDRTGGFAFLPDKPGTWRVIVSDGQGHRIEANVPVASSPDQLDPAFPVSGYGGAAGRDARTLKIIGALCGISLIFNIFFMIYSRRKKIRQ